MGKKKKDNIAKNDIEDIATLQSNAADKKVKDTKVIDEKLDGKQRTVQLITDGKEFFVVKAQQNAPFLQNFKTEKEALKVFNEKVECTNN